MLWGYNPTVALSAHLSGSAQQPASFIGHHWTPDHHQNLFHSTPSMCCCWWWQVLRGKDLGPLDALEALGSEVNKGKNGKRRRSSKVPPKVRATHISTCVRPTPSHISKMPLPCDLLLLKVFTKSSSSTWEGSQKCYKSLNGWTWTAIQFPTLEYEKSDWYFTPSFLCQLFDERVGARWGNYVSGCAIVGTAPF